MDRRASGSMRPGRVGAVKQTKQSAMTLGVMTLAKVKVVEESSVQQAVQTEPGYV